VTSVAPSVTQSANPTPQAPATSPAPSATPIDWAALAASLGTGDAFIDQLAKVLASNLANKPEALLRAAEAGDMATLAREAHSVKGVAGNVKAEAAFALAREAEMAARESNPQAAPLARQLAAQVDGLIDAARRRLDKRD
jgi:HPt (histidine-containing phosphotransfer) domain-containing protein